MSILPTSTQINIDNRIYSIEIDSSKLAELIENKIIKQAFCQYSIDTDKIEDLIKIYNSKNGHEIHELRKQITFAVYQGQNNEYEYFNIDGQHRMRMGIRLWKEFKKNLKFSVKFVFCNTTNEILYIFRELNYSDIRPEPPINYFLWDIRNILTNKYKEYFAKKIRKHSHLYTINEFIINLQQINIEKHLEDKKYENAEEFLEKLIKSNKEFNSKVNENGYTQMQNIHTSSNKIFYKDELEILEKHEPLTFAFKRNNFIFKINYDDNKVKRGWFLRKQTNNPHHEKYNPSVSISQSMKKEVWEKEYEDICDTDDNIFELEQKCPVYKCNNKIKFETCEMGHLRSRANGGKSNRENLRPICRSCNQKMSDNNWTDYERDIKRELNKL